MDYVEKVSNIDPNNWQFLNSKRNQIKYVTSILHTICGQQYKMCNPKHSAKCENIKKWTACIEYWNTNEATCNLIWVAHDKIFDFMATENCTCVTVQCVNQAKNDIFCYKWDGTKVKSIKRQIKIIRVS